MSTSQRGKHDTPTVGGLMLRGYLRAHHTYLKWLTPRPSGLPNLWVLLAVPVAFTLVVGILVVLGISGSSTGAYWDAFGTGSDPDRLVGGPRHIRSDEWLVQSSWIVSQVQQGFPVVNGTFPGGMDATIQNDLPSWDWSSLFRPHVLGFMVFPLDQGMAIRWWLPALVLMIGVYVFVVSVLPTRPVMAVFVSGAVFYSPIIQWWFLPTTIWPVAWAFVAVTAMVWLFKCRRLWIRILWSALTAYLAVTMAMSIYVPFMIPAILVVAVFAVGALLHARFSGGFSWRQILGRVAPLLVAAVSAGAVMAAWILTRWETIVAVTSTVYPGQRLEETGVVDTANELAALFIGPFQWALTAGATDVIAPNQSEAAAPLLLILFLAPPMIWAAWPRMTARGRRADWLLMGTLVCSALVLAFLLIPEWDSLAHALFIDRTTSARSRLAFTILSGLAMVLLVRRLDDIRDRVPWWLTAISTALVGVVTGAVWVFLDQNGSVILGAGPAWVACTTVLALAVFLLCRNRSLAASASFLLATLIVSVAINPWYVGVFDLRETQAGKQIAAIAAENPGAQWLGVGGYIPTAMLVESGVHAYNGVQTYPPREMWDVIDPAGAYEQEWNRLANVNWTVGEGEPVVTTVERDQIRVSFDSCSTFAQQNVDFVLSDEEIDQRCLTTVAKSQQGETVLWIYEVTPASS